MTQAISKQSNGESEQEQQVKQQKQQSQAVGSREVHEKTSSANASAGLNLNLFAALSGAFTSSTQKTTQKAADGTTVTTEQNHNKGAANAAAQGHGSAYAAGNASQREVRSKEKGVEGMQRQSVEASAREKKGERVDHLGIES